MDAERLSEGIKQYSVAQAEIAQLREKLGMLWNDYNVLTEELRKTELRAERALAMVRAAGEQIGPASFPIRVAESLHILRNRGVTTSSPRFLTELGGLEKQVAELQSMGLVVLVHGEVRLSRDGSEILRKMNERP